MTDKGDKDPFSDFLYPFLDDTEQVSLETVLAEVRQSTLQKVNEVTQLRQQFIDEYQEQLVSASQAMAERFVAGGQLLAFGNGGSATDAQDIVADFLNPDGARTALPAISLTNDIGVVTAVGNDVGFDNVYTRQMIAYGTSNDIAIGFSTSGESANILAAFQQAQKMNLLTVGITGYDGGKLAKANLDYCFIVRSTYVPRIQEVHATVYHTLWELTHRILQAK